MAKKHIKIVFTLECPLPKTFTFREEAGGVRAAMGRAFAKLRKHVGGKPLRKGKAEWEMMDIWPDVEGIADVEPDDALKGKVEKEEEEVDEQDEKEEAEEEAEEEKEEAEEEEEEEEPKKKGKKEEKVREEEEDDEDDQDDEDEEDEDEEEEEKEEGMNYDDLMVAISEAEEQKTIDELVEEFITPFDWSVDEMKAFNDKIAETKKTWKKAEAPAKPAKGKKEGSAFANVMALAKGKK